MYYTLKQLRVKTLAASDLGYGRSLVGCALDAIRYAAPYRVAEAREAWCALDVNAELRAATPLGDVLAIDRAAFLPLPASHGLDTWRAVAE